MKLMINHQTHYSYQEPVRRSMQYIRMIPQDSSRQTIQNWMISVAGEQIRQHDGFGNIWMSVSQRYHYHRLMIMAQGTVDIDTHAEYTVDHVNHQRVPVDIYRQSTVRTECSPAMQEFARDYLQPGQEQGLVPLAQALLRYIPYNSGLTHVETTAAQAFEQRLGVCQDHTQVFVSMARYLGFAARYVSGYLYVPSGDHLASHAWAEVEIGGRWYCFDVSNQLFRPEAHVQVAVGRDYADAAPVRGVRTQGTNERLHTVVQVLAC